MMMSLDSRNEDLNKKIDDTDLPSAVRVLIDDAKKRRNQIRWLVVSITLDFILTIGLTVLSIRTNQVASLAQSNRTALIQNCETSNDSRERQRALWAYVIALPPQQPPTPEQQKRVEEFQKFVDTTFSQRDCQAEANKAFMK